MPHFSAITDYNSCVHENNKLVSDLKLIIDQRISFIFVVIRRLYFILINT